MSLSNNRWLLVAAGHFFLLFLVSQLNHYLSPIHLNILLIGLLITFSALILNFRQGALSLIPIALFLDSKSPLGFGTSLIMMISLFSFLYMARSRFRRESLSMGSLISLAMNVSMFSAYSVATVKQLGASHMNFGLLFWNLFWSSSVILILHKPYFIFQIQMLSFFGIRIAEEQREA